MSENNTKIFEMASGDISVWIDGGIHMKLNTTYKDPVELRNHEALELGQLLIRLANEQRG